MARMKLFERIKAAMRRWLGLDDLASRNLIATIEQANRTRHSEIMTALGRIEQRLTVAQTNPAIRHIAPILDWETVQAIALNDLEKESNETSGARR